MATTLKWSLVPLTDPAVAASFNDGGPEKGRSKIVHLIRHGQAVHNLVMDTEQYKLEKFLDCPLSAQGFDQVAELRRQVAASPPPGFPVDLIVVSPLLRTLQTAVGAFGPPNASIPVNLPPIVAPPKDGGQVTNGIEASAPETVVTAPVMAEGGNLVTTTTPAHILANELCRETLHVHVCDKRRPIREKKGLFSSVDFSQIAHDEDAIWKVEPRETRAEIAQRATDFAEWLLGLKEQSIAVVSHSGFLHAFATVGLPTYLRPENKLLYFENCRLRSYILSAES